MPACACNRLRRSGRDAARRAVRTIVVRRKVAQAARAGMSAYRKPARDPGFAARRALRSAPIRGIAVRMLEEIEKKTHAQRQMPPLRKHRVNADGRRGEIVEHAD